MAGAMTAVLKPQHGLYMLIFPAFVYAFLGSSPQNHVGGMPVSAALTGVSAARLRELFHPENETTRSAGEILDLQFHIAGSICLVSGVLQVKSYGLKILTASNEGSCFR